MNTPLETTVTMAKTSMHNTMMKQIDGRKLFRTSVIMLVLLTFAAVVSAVEYATEPPDSGKTGACDIRAHYLYGGVEFTDTPEWDAGEYSLCNICGDADMAAAFDRTKGYAVMYAPCSVGERPAPSPVPGGFCDTLRWGFKLEWGQGAKLVGGVWDGSSTEPFVRWAFYDDPYGTPANKGDHNHHISNYKFENDPKMVDRIAREDHDPDRHIFLHDGARLDVSSLVVNDASGRQIHKVITDASGQIQGWQEGTNIRLIYDWPSGYGRGISENNGIVIPRWTYMRPTEDAYGIRVRQRVTVWEPMGNGNGQFKTTILGYYGVEAGSNKYGRLKFEISPEGIARFLEDVNLAYGIQQSGASEACPLDDPTIVTDDALRPYAKTWVADYTQWGSECLPSKVETMKGCGGCGGSQTKGVLSYGYAANASYPASPTRLEAFNTWLGARRMCKLDAQGVPMGLRTVEFNNVHGTPIYVIKQEMVGDTISKVWTTHYKYDANGQLIEKRHPSACVNYQTTSANGWITSFTPDDNGTVGMVTLYGRETDTALPVLWDVQWEKTRNGTASTQPWTWISRQKRQRQVPTGQMRVTEEVKYPTWTTDPNDSSRLVTQHEYILYPNTDIVEYETTIHPAVSIDRNGSGVSAREMKHYQQDPLLDLYWNDWTKQPNGSVTYTEVGSGVFNLRKPVKVIEDADITRTSDFCTPVPGLFQLLPYPPGPGVAQHRITTYTYRDETDGGLYGSARTVTYPDGRIGRSTSLPINKTVDDQGTIRVTTVAEVHLRAAGNDPVDISVSVCAGGNLISARGTGLSPAEDLNDYLVSDYLTGVLPVRDLDVAMLGTSHTPISRQDNYYDANSQLIESRQFFQLPTSGGGQLGTDYWATRYRYDPVTWQRSHTIRIVSGTGHANAVEEVTRTLYDQLGRAVSTMMGTSPASEDLGENWDNEPANMVTVSMQFYDQSQPGTGTGGVGDGNVTEQRRYTDASTFRRTVVNYDWRNRRTASLSADNIAQISTLDNFGRATMNLIYAPGTLQGGVIQVAAPEDPKLMNKGETFLDQRGQVWKTVAHEVLPGTGPTGNKLTTLSWFDAMGRTVKTSDPKGLFQKTVYDTLGKGTKTFMCFDTDETGYDAADDVDGDTVIEQTLTVFDPLSGRVLQTASYQRHDNGTGEGELTTLNAAPRYSSKWYDADGRMTHSVDYGDNGLQVFTRPQTPPEPNTTDDAIVAKTEYDFADRPYRVTDNKGIVRETTVDAMGRTIKTVEATGLPEERWTLYQYDGLGNRTRLITDLGRNDTYSAGGWTTDADSEVTRYLYEHAVQGNLLTSLIRPDSADTTSAGTDQLKYQYNWLGQLTRSTDPLGVIRDFTYDNGGRPTSDTATTIPAPTDGRIRRYDRAYNDAGQLIRVTGYKDTAATQVDHETRYEYGTWGNMTAMRQAHAGAADGNSPAVTFEYENGAVGGEAKYARLKKTVYPNGRQVYNNYGSDAVSVVLSRLEDIADGNGPSRVKYVTYSYRGAGTVIKTGHPAVSGGLNLTHGVNGVYPGFDRFGRIVDQKWTKDDSTILDRTTHAYDRAGNRVDRQVDGQADKTETYGYDALGQLIDFERLCPLNTDYLHGYWKFDETTATTAYDASINALNGTLQGGATWTSAGRIGGCVTLDGVDDYVKINHDGIHSPGYKNFAISAWIKTTADTGSIVHKSNSTTGDDYQLKLKNGSIRFSFNVGGATISALATTLVNDGQWHHVLGYRFGTWKARVYIDGVLEDTGSLSSAPDTRVDVNTALYIGRKASGGELFAGRIDDVRYYYNLTVADTTIRALAQGHEADWQLDGIGNWTAYTEDAVAQTRTHNLGNELTQVNGSAAHIQHDAAGNMTFVPKVGAETSAHWTMTYDAWNRIAAVKDGATLIAEYRYDADNKRIAKIQPNGSNWRRTDYFHDNAWRVLEERYANSEASKEAVPTPVKCQYVWDSRYLDACAVRWRDGNDDGDFLDTNEVLYYLHDAHFNVTALVDPSGNVQERYAYEPYGLPTIADARWITRAASTFDNQILFSGYRWDAEDQLYHVRNRYYHPTLGRWVTRDPIGEDGGVHQHAFCKNNSIMFFDVKGLSIYRTDQNYPLQADGAPWSSKTLGATEYGRTDATLLTGSECCKYVGDSGVSYKIVITFSVYQEIYLNKQKWGTDPSVTFWAPGWIAPDGPTDPPTPAPLIEWSAKKAYGHEQRHVKNFIDFTGTVMKPWFDTEETAAGTFADEPSCKAKAALIEAAGSAHWTTEVRGKEVTHQHNPPTDKTLYEPIGTFPSTPTP